jgi:MraZ protein
LGGFLGSFRHQIDEKGRVALPASFRRLGGEEPFVLLDAGDRALFLYPASAWRRLAEQLLGLRRRDTRSRMRVLRLTANAVEVVPDKQGRILIPERLKAAAELEDEVLIVGALDRVELWNPRVFDEVVAAESEGEADGFVRRILS